MQIDKKLPQILAAAFLIGALILTSIAQILPSDDEKTEREKKLREDVVAMLRETAVEARGLKSRSNRIAAGVEIAAALARFDKSEARDSFGPLMEDFKAELTPVASEIVYKPMRSNSNVTFDAPRGRYFKVPSDRWNARFQQLMKVRARIADAVGASDLATAFGFLNETTGLISDTAQREIVEKGDKSAIRTTIATNVSEQPEAAARIMSRLTADGIEYNDVSICRAIFNADRDAGSALASVMASNLKADTPLYAIRELLDFAIQVFDESKKDSSKKNMLSESEIRSLTSHYADVILRLESSSESGVSRWLSFDSIDRFAPAKAAALRRKFPQSTNQFNDRPMVRKTPGPVPSPTAPESTDLKARTDGIDAVRKASSLTTMKLTEKERQALLKKAREYVASYSTPGEKFGLLLKIADEAARSGEKEIAAELLAEARSMLPENPRKVSDCDATWAWASTNVLIEPEKSFTTIESMIPWLSTVAEALLVFGEFMDDDERDITDNEFQFGTERYGIASSLVRALATNEAGIANLAQTDFARTKALADKFDRVELRIIGKLAIANAVDSIGKPKPNRQLGGDEPSFE